MAQTYGDDRSTDWDRVYREKDPRLTEVHRGLRLWPHYDVYQHVNDQSRPVHERARALLGHIGDLMKHEGRGIGMSWTDSPSVARQAAVEGGWSHHGLTGRPDSRHSDYDDRPFPMPVVLNAAWPDKEHIETRPHVLEHHGVFGYESDLSQGEVPLRHDTPVKITGISWKRGGQGDTWNHHVFDEPVHYNGSGFEGLEPRTAGADLIGHFEAANSEGGELPDLSARFPQTRLPWQAHPSSSRHGDPGHRFLNDLLDSPGEPSARAEGRDMPKEGQPTYRELTSLTPPPGSSEGDSPFIPAGHRETAPVERMKSMWDYAHYPHSGYSEEQKSALRTQIRSLWSRADGVTDCRHAECPPWQCREKRTAAVHEAAYEAPPREYSAGRMLVSDIRRPGEGRLSDRPYTQDELAGDIRANGVQQPLAIEHLPAHGGPTTFNGLHRLDAAERAGVADVPVVVKHQPGDYPPMTERRPSSEEEFSAAYDLERAGRWAGGHTAAVQVHAAFVPAAERTESVRHILDNYVPYDADTWDEVRANYRWDSPSMREFVDDVRRNGVKRPVPIDYEQDPPQVRNGHTRLLAAERAGVETTPVRQHAGFMDPDDPDPQGRGPDDPEHWTNKPEWQASLKEEFGPEGEPSGDCKDSREAALLGHFEAADGDYRMQHTAPSPESGRPLHHYEGGSPEDHVRIYRAAPANTESINPGDWISLNSGYAHSHGYASGPNGSDWPVYTAEVPQKHVHWDENDPNEHGYNGPAVHHPDVHDEETGGTQSWEDYHDENPHGLEGWAGASAHLSPEDHEFVHDGDEDETDRADRLLAAAHAQRSMRGARWRGDMYEARDDAEEHAQAHAHEAPQGHRVTAFTVHRSDDGGIDDFGVHRFRQGDDPAGRRYPFIDVEGYHYHDHPALGGGGNTRRWQLEAAVQHHGISGETAPESRDVFASPTGISPVDSHHADVMQHPEKTVRVNERGENEWVHPHLSAPDHGPYYVTRDPEDPDNSEGTLHVLDRHGRSTNGAYKGGSWQHANAYRDWHRLTYREDPEEEGTSRDVPSIIEDHDRHLAANPPQFPHSRTDPRDTEILKRPDARVARPEGHSPSDEYHGSYEVVRHPDTGRFHVVDNAGRMAGAGYSGAPTQLGAERSRDYIEKRQKSKEIGRGIADSIFSKSMDILDPGGTEESRQSERNMATATDMMGRYEGGRGQVKFDSDEEGGAPYYEREHHLDNGRPSGWYAKHYGGPFAEIRHRATGDESHDMMRFPEHPEDEGTMTPRLHPGFRDEHLAESLKNWHDDEEGQARQYLEANDPRISRWKKRRLGAVHPVVAHFEDPEPRPFTAAAAPGGGEEYKPKPEWQYPPEGATDEEASADFDRQNAVKHAWESHVLHGISTGKLDPHRAKELGYYFDGHQTDDRGNPKWQPLPQHLYHVTTSLPGVREHGLKTRRELEQARGGHGLGGGPDDMISLTDSHDTARNILRAVHEFHQVVNGRYTPAQMWEDAKAGKGAPRPFHEDLAGYHQSGWKDGDPLPRGLYQAIHGVRREYTGGSSQEMIDKARGPGWRPAADDKGWMSGHVPPQRVHSYWERDEDPDERRAHAADFYKNFAAYRSWAGGHEDPLFFSTDTKAFAAKDPKDFAIVHARPKPGAMGHPVSALGEWRTGTGDALETHRAERLEDGHLKEASVSAIAARYAPGLPNPQTGGDEWFHGTQSQPGDFVHGFSHNDSHNHEEEELTGHLAHWNTLLGSHFAADHGVAEHFARQGASTHDDEEDWGGDDPSRSRYQTKDPQSVIHARLHLRNPKVYDSEFDMDHEAYEHEYGKRKNYISKHFGEGYEDEDPHGEDYDPDTPGEGEEWPLAARYRHDDKQPIPREQMQRRTLFSNPDMPEMPERTRWLASHPDKEGIARRFKERLQAQGHDGILYGNEFEDNHATGDGNHWNLSAIAFHPGQTEITQHHQAGAPCLSAEEGEHQRGRMPQPGQEELPGVEEHADGFPNGFLRGHAVVAHFEDKPVQKTAAPVYMQQKLFHRQPDPTLNTLESGRHNPEDPLKRVRHRQETEEGYVPPAETFDHPEYGNRDEERGIYRHPEKGWHCNACTAHEGEPVFHDDPEDVDRHDTTRTDWDSEYPRIPATVHRGMRLDDDGSYGRSHLHAYRDVPAAERTAREILGRFGDLGTHWTGDEQQARHYAAVGGGNYRPRGDTMNVVVHARKPEREDIETDPETLADQNVFGMGYHDDEEIPLQEGTPVHVSGVSWKFHDEPESAWRRHDFDEHPGHTAAVAEPSGPDLARMLDQAADRESAAHQDDLKYVPDWEPLHRALPAPEHGGWMFMNRNGHPAGIVSYKHGITRTYLHADQEGNAWRRISGAEGPVTWEGPVHPRDWLNSKGHYDDLRAMHAAPETPYDDDYRAQRNRALQQAGYDVVEGRTPGEHTGAVTGGPDAEGGGDTLDSFRYHSVQPYVASPQDYGQGRDHLIAHHGYTPEMHMPRNLPGLQNVHRGLHLPGPAGPASHQHDDPDDHHDPVFGSTAAMTGGPAELSDREQRSDRWHEFQGRFGDDLHRGIYTQLPDRLHMYVHYPDEPREKRAQALQEHFSGQGLGMHWTPHLSIANRSVANAAEGHEYDDDDDYGGYDDYEDLGGHSALSGTDVIFHVKRPGERNRLRNPEQLQQHEVGHQFSQDEDEFPVKPGSPLRLSGISWKEHDPEHPMEPYEHVDFDKPMRHVSSVAAPAIPAVVAHFEEGPLPEYHGEPLYHGTRSILEPGEHLTVEEAGQHPNNADIQTDPYVHATTDPREAHRWGERADGAQAQRRMKETGRGQRGMAGQNVDTIYRPRVYEVHPTGAVEPDLEYSDTEHDSWRSASPMRVGREVEALPCYHCHDEGAAEDEHWPDHPHYEYLRQQADEDDAEREERGHYGSKAVQASGEPHIEPPQDDGEMWSHLQEAHGARPSPGSAKTPGADFMSALHRRFHNGKSAFPGAVPHHHGTPASSGDAGPSREELMSRMFTPVPSAELEEQRRARLPKPERLDDRDYSVGDVSRHYDWEGFDPYEISHLVHHPEKATFTREDVPVHSLRLAGENGRLEPPRSYEDIAAQDDDERERLGELERGYGDDAPVPPIVTVRDGEHHIIADGSHRAAIYARQGHTHIPAFVTQRTIYPGGHTAAVTAAYDWATDEGPYTWDEIAHRHPRVYGDDEDHEPGMGEGGGEAIADAAAELYHDRPSHPYSESEGELPPYYGAPGSEIQFHPRTVDVNRIDYMRAERGDERVIRARKGFEDHRQRDKIPPLVLVHRHGVYQVADGHHRANGAAQAGWPSVRAYVAYSPHEDEPFAGKYGDPPQKGPFNGAETRDRPPMTDHNGEPARRISFPGFPHTTERSRPTPHEASRHEAITLIPVYDTAAIEAGSHTVCPRVDAVVEAIGLLGAWEPQDARDAAQGVIALKEVFEALCTALRHVAGVIDEMPVDCDVAEGLHEMARIARTASEDCERTAPRLPPEATWEEPPAPPNR